MRWLRIVVLAMCAGGAASWLGPTASVVASSAGGGCSPGAHTLAPPGSRLYPDTGNGGYTSLHTLIQMVYDADANRFLPGNRVVLTDRATQCLTSFSLDFERHSANTSGGPDMSVVSVRVNGHPARFHFVQPTYPGDPNGQNDPDPPAHEASQTNPVGGPSHNPLPPACSPELPSPDAPVNSQNGTQCPANKLVIIPATPIRDGARSEVRRRVHRQTRSCTTTATGSTEGWFRSRGDGGFVTTEPVGTEDWMPLNDYPSGQADLRLRRHRRRPGSTVVANGRARLGARTMAPAAQFPHGSVTWHWHSARRSRATWSRTASATTGSRAERSAGSPTTEAQAWRSAPRGGRRTQVMRMQPDITAFERRFTGPFPFSTDGSSSARPPASFDEEMQGMITFSGGSIDTDTLYHENMHQWWGDNVSEDGYHMTFFKEGMATVAEILYDARWHRGAAGGPSTAAGRAAFQQQIVEDFDQIYSENGDFWTVAPSNPKPFSLFSDPPTYLRPAIAYVALRQILGHGRFTKALEHIQRAYGGSSITEPQLEAAFHRWLPVKTSACQTRLTRFFTQWFDTAYPPGGGANRPSITGPGLDGRGFYGPDGRCGTLAVARSSAPLNASARSPRTWQLGRSR